MTAPAVIFARAGGERARLAALAAGAGLDVVIIGAGINGAGLFRELTAQGLSCLIFDKNDFGSGTSAAPSRLIHGGLKYLETGEFRLVAESTLERNLLLQNAPHYVRPLPTIIPIFSWMGGVWPAIRTMFGSKEAPRSRGAALIKIGLWLYDWYGRRHRVMPRHRMTGREQALRNLPALTRRIVATATYHDALITHPERLVLELIEEGLELETRSAAANYMTLEGLVDGALRFTDQETGEVHSVRARLVVNAAGPWIDQVNARLGRPTSYIGGTKGSHILLDHDELVRLLGDRMIYFEADDGRVCLVYPYLGRALVGSTDIRADDPDDVMCADEEIDYLLESLRNLLPGLTFSREQIVYTYCGIRPLPRSDANVTGLISRDHSAPVCEPAADRPFPTLSLVGGKWTTFRGFGEEVADEVLTRLGAARRTGTREMPIGGGKGFPSDASARRHWIGKTAAECGLAQDRIELLLDRYGTTASIVSRYLIQDAGDKPLTHAADYSTREIDYIARHEHVRHLEDIILRRTTLAVLGLATGPLITEIASIAGRALGWSDARRAGEIKAVLRNLATRHGVLFATASTD